MDSHATRPIDSQLARIDFAAIPAPGDKIRECAFFLGLASTETDRDRFRWLVSAYLNAVYSYFETTALWASVAFTHPETGEPIVDTEAIDKLRPYVAVRPQKNKYRIQTCAVHPVVVELIEARHGTTHRFPLAVMEAGTKLPEDFHLGNVKGEGKPLLALCRDALAVIKQVQAQLDA
jgi:hypothetical protein